MTAACQIALHMPLVLVECQTRNPILLAPLQFQGRRAKLWSHVVKDVKQRIRSLLTRSTTSKVANNVILKSDLLL